MVLKYTNLKVAFIVLLLSLITSSCEKEMFVIVDCSNCTTEEPSVATVTVTIKSDPYIFSQLQSLYVYEGDEATGNPIIQYNQFFSFTIDLDLSINRTYTFVAVYVSEGKTYRAVDSIRPSVKYTESQCDEACYFVFNNKVNLKLKYL